MSEPVDPFLTPPPGATPPGARPPGATPPGARPTGSGPAPTGEGRAPDRAPQYGQPGYGQPAYTRPPYTNPVPQPQQSASPYGRTPAADPSAYGQPAAYGQQPYGQPQYGAAPAYGQQPYGQAPGGPGQLGRIRPTGTMILLFFVTLGIYQYFYNYRVHDEIKKHSGQGLGGGIALLLTFLAGAAMPFVTPSEVGGLYKRRGEKPPVTGLTGLWYALSFAVGLVVVLVGGVASAVSAGSTVDPVTGATTISDAAAVGLVGSFALFLVIVLVGSLIGFAKTNGALNRYWASMGARP